MSTDQHESPSVGWAVKAASPEEYARRDGRSATLRAWLSLRNVLIVVLLLWNGCLLTLFLYGLSAHYSAADDVRSIVVTLWMWGDIAILFIAGAVWGIRRHRRRVA